MREIVMSDTDDTDFLKLIDDLSGSKEINCKNRIRKRLYQVMRKLKAEFRGFFNPKETWFVLPLFIVDYSWGRLTIAIGWLCFGVGLEIWKEDE